MRRRRTRFVDDKDEPSRPYQPLPPEMRPCYSGRTDLRLLEQAFRNGWVDDAPIERKKEWVEDIMRALGDESDCTKRTALRTMMAVFVREDYLKEKAMEIWASMPPEAQDAIKAAIREDAELAGDQKPLN